MTMESCTLGWAFTFLLCIQLFHGSLGDCPSPPTVPNTVPITETSGAPGQTIVYRCDHDAGYYEIPNKSNTITCQNNDDWTVIEEFCARACGAPGQLEYAMPKKDSINQNIFLPNTTMTYDCRNGYKRIYGRKNSITCLEDYTWSIPEVFCERKSCGNPGEIQNGDFETEDFLFGSRVTYTCNEGYRMTSKRPYRDCQADGIWSNDLPECEVVICPPPNAPTDGEYNPQKDEYYYLDSITFTCLKNLEIAGERSAHCTAAGTWSSDVPTCKAVNCPDPDVPNSIRLSGFSGPYTLNSAISFECKKGFILKGERSITCNIHSQWDSPIPTCEPVCPDPVVPNSKRLSGLSGPYTPNSAISFECEEGFVLKGNHLIKCTTDGQWYPAIPTCKLVQCHPPHVPNSKARRIGSTGTSYRLNSSISFECDEGYFLQGQSPISCNIDGHWVPGIPTCEIKSGYTPKNTILGLSIGGIVGITIAVIVGLLIIICVLWRCWKKNKKRGNPQPETLNVQYSHCEA